MIHGYGSTMDQVWINVDQRGSTAFSLSLQHVASACPFSLPPCVLTHGSCVMRQASTSGVRRQTHGSCVMRQASCVMRHASCVRRQTHGSCVMRHASCVRRQTHGSCVMRQASCVMRRASHASDSWLMRQASGVPRFRRQASGVMAHGSCVPRPFSTIQPPPVVGHDDNTAAAFPHATPFRFAPIALYGMG